MSLSHAVEVSHECKANLRERTAPECIRGLQLHVAPVSPTFGEDVGRGVRCTEGKMCPWRKDSLRALWYVAARFDRGGRSRDFDGTKHDFRAGSTATMSRGLDLCEVEGERTVNGGNVDT